MGMSKSDRSSRRPYSISSLARKPGKRQPNKYVLIVCGGTDTEPNYFKALRRELRLGTVQVPIRGTRLDPLAVVNLAISMRVNYDFPFDEVWCVLDVENPNDNQLFPQAVDKARGNRVLLAVSNPAFEYWYLLHYKETNQPFIDATHLLNALKAFLPMYSKSADIFLEVFKHMDIAIQRAERLLASHPDKSKHFPNPSTSVHLLVASLKGMAE
jgi:hypothetical protein